MRTPHLVLSSVLGLGLLCAPTSASDGEDGWVEVGRTDGITVLRKEIPGDPVFAYRGKGTLKAPLGKIISVSRDVKRQPEWINRLEEARVVREITPMHRILYMKVNTPWPVSDRDFVVESKLTVDREKRVATLEVRSVEEPSLPVDDCCVRGQMHRNHIVLTGSADGLTTDVDAEAHVDPKGSIPKWMVNAIQKTFPQKSLKGLLRQVSKPDILDYFR